MARRSRKRNYYKKGYGYKRYKQVASRNYFKVKAEYYDEVAFPQNSGQPVFSSTVLDEAYLVKNVLTLKRIMEKYTYVTTLAGLFSYWKLLSVAVELIPLDEDSQVVDPVQIFMGFRMGKSTVMTLSEIKAVNQNMMLDPRNRQRRYWRTYGNYGDWTQTDTYFEGGLSVASGRNSILTDQRRWTIKVSLYLLYKYSKA